MAKATLTKKRAYPAKRPCQMPETIWVMIRVTKVGFFPLTVKRSYTSAEGNGLSLAIWQDGQKRRVTANQTYVCLSALCADVAATLASAQILSQRQLGGPDRQLNGHQLQLTLPEEQAGADGSPGGGGGGGGEPPIQWTSPYITEPQVCTALCCLGADFGAPCMPHLPIKTATYTAARIGRCRCSSAGGAGQHWGRTPLCGCGC